MVFFIFIILFFGVGGLFLFHSVLFNPDASYVQWLQSMCLMDITSFNQGLKHVHENPPILSYRLKMGDQGSISGRGR